MSEERILLGMMRPLQSPADTLPVGNYVVRCPCGMDLWARESVQKHWMLGHFDTPVYATREEILEKVVERIAKQVKPE